MTSISRGPEISPGGRGICVLCRRERTFLQKDSSFSAIEMVTPCAAISITQDDCDYPLCLRHSKQVFTVSYFYHLSAPQSSLNDGE